MKNGKILGLNFVFALISIPLGFQLCFSRSEGYLGIHHYSKDKGKLQKTKRQLKTLYMPFLNSDHAINYFKQESQVIKTMKRGIGRC
jgi:hypothetical protein